MIEVATADFRPGIVAHRQPRLRCIAFLQIIRRATPAHFGGDPARIDGVGVDIRPFARHSHAQHQHMQLGIRIADAAASRGETLQIGAPL